MPSRVAQMFCTVIAKKQQLVSKKNITLFVGDRTGKTSDYWEILWKKFFQEKKSRSLFTIHFHFYHWFYHLVWLVFWSCLFVCLFLFLFLFFFFPLKGFTSAPETDSDKFTKCYAISVSGAKELTIFSDTHDLLVEKGNILWRTYKSTGYRTWNCSEKRKQCFIRYIRDYLKYLLT